jgi:hypothetical protein
VSGRPQKNALNIFFLETFVHLDSSLMHCM